MIISAGKVSSLSDQEEVRKLFRIKNPLSPDDNSDFYTYFSKSNMHSNYFLVKKMFGIIDTKYDINLKSLTSSNYESKLDRAIEALKNDSSSFDFIDYQYFIFAAIDDLMKENAYSNRNKPENGFGLLERVDTHTFGGGYGLADSWKELMDLVIVFNRTNIIDKSCVINFLSELRDISLERRISSFGEIYRMIASIRDFSSPCNINESIFTRNYSLSIEDKLYEIIQKGLCKPNSNLALKPKESIHMLTQQVNMEKKKVLSAIKRI